ncbi:MAG: hypothetical protein ABII01_03885 [Candidatus Woesearchaeota archaeon]
MNDRQAVNIDDITQTDEKILYETPLDLLERFMISYLKEEFDKRGNDYRNAIGSEMEQDFLASFRLFNDYRNAMQQGWFERAEKLAQKDQMPPACAIYARRRELVRIGKLVNK